MTRPPIKAFETVRKYCEQNKTCEGCPLHDERKYIVDWCNTRHCYWKSLEEGEKNEID